MNLRWIQIIFLIIFSIKCCNNDPYCRRCIHNETVPICDLCQYSYFNTSTQTCDKKILKISNCEIYKQDFDEIICDKCQIGYYSTRNNCIACPLNCGTCNNNGLKCQSCVFSILVKNGRCQYSDTIIKCNDPNCYSCNEQNQCIMCNNDYVLNNQNVCVKGVSNCLKLQDNTTEKCDTCLYGYYITQDFRCINNKPKKSFLFQTLLLIFIFALIISPFLYVLYRKHSQMRERQQEQEDREILI